MTDEQKRMGRPPLPEGEALTARMEIKLSPEQKAKAMLLGGSKWIRERIDRARLPEPPKE